MHCARCSDWKAQTMEPADLLDLFHLRARAARRSWKTIAEEAREAMLRQANVKRKRITRLGLQINLFQPGSPQRLAAERELAQTRMQLESVRADAAQVTELLRNGGV